MHPLSSAAKTTPSLLHVPLCPPFLSIACALPSSPHSLLRPSFFPIVRHHSSLPSVLFTDFPVALLHSDATPPLFHAGPSIVPAHFQYTLLTHPSVSSRLCWVRCLACLIVSLLFSSYGQFTIPFLDLIISPMDVLSPSPLHITCMPHVPHISRLVPSPCLFPYFSSLNALDSLCSCLSGLSAVLPLLMFVLDEL